MKGTLGFLVAMSLLAKGPDVALGEPLQNGTATFSQSCGTGAHSLPMGRRTEISAMRVGRFRRIAPPATTRPAKAATAHPSSSLRDLRPG